MSQQRWQNYPQPRYRISVPPPDETQGGYIVIPRVVYWSTTIIVLGALLVLLSTGLIHGFSYATLLWDRLHPTSTPTRTVNPLQINQDITCPLQAQAQPDTAPSLQFCSPIYAGNVAGPFGAHIVLIGANLSAQPTGWWLTEDKDDPTACFKNHSRPHYCIALPAPATKTTSKQGQGSQQNLTILFSWTWNNPFPAGTGKSYIISTLVANKPITTPNNIDFTLLSSQSPCILIDKPPAKNDPLCTQGNYPFLKSGTEHTLYGTNWLLGWKPDPTHTIPLDMSISIAAICAPWLPQGACSRSVLFLETVKASEINRDGTFMHKIQIPPHQSGMYIVQAVNKTLSSTTDNINTVADQALSLDIDNSQPLLISKFPLLTIEVN